MEEKPQSRPGTKPTLLDIFKPHKTGGRSKSAKSSKTDSLEEQPQDGLKDQKRQSQDHQKVCIGKSWKKVVPPFSEGSALRHAKGCPGPVMTCITIHHITFMIYNLYHI